jgi:hypothetical protein
LYWRGFGVGSRKPALSVAEGDLRFVLVRLGWETTNLDPPPLATWQPGLPAAEKLDPEVGRGPRRQVLVAGVEGGDFNPRKNPSIGA